VNEDSWVNPKEESPWSWGGGSKRESAAARDNTVPKLGKQDLKHPLRGVKKRLRGSKKSGSRITKMPDWDAP